MGQIAECRWAGCGMCYGIVLGCVKRSLVGQRDITGSAIDGIVVWRY